MSNKNNPLEDLNKPISDDAIFKVAKEVAIKFIEVGRLSPETFSERFENIYASIQSTVRKNQS